MKSRKPTTKDISDKTTPVQKIEALLKLKQPKYITRQFIEKTFPSFYEQLVQLTDWLSEDVAPTHRMYCVVNGIDFNVPCRQCNNAFDRKLIKFTQDKQSYLDAFCSQRCQIEHRESVRAIETSNKRGLTPKCATPGCNNLVKWQVGASQYSAHCSNQCKFRDQQVLDKRRQTNVEKYGHQNVLASEVGRTKTKQTNMQKYGVENPTQRPEVIEQTMRQSYQRISQRWTHLVPLFDFDEYKQYEGYNVPHYYMWKCNQCDNQFGARLTSSNPPKCPKCNPRNISQGHKQISEFLTSLGVEHINNDRSIISPGELDIYVPARKLAIEYDGLYWHREQSVGKKYHIEKTQQCLQQGVSLLHVFEDEWLNKQDIVKSIIKSKLGINRKIAARKTTIQQIDRNTKKKFLDQYHIQGSDHHSEVGLGMLYDNQLIGVATFCKSRSVGVKTRFKDYWELARMAFVPDTTVVGGVSKLISHFKSLGVADGLYTFADLRYSNANTNGYNQLMVFSHLTTQNYWYFNASCQQKWHRYNFAKHMLPNKLPSFDPNLTEFENMTNHGFFRIWDCGNACYFIKFR